MDKKLCLSFLTFLLLIGIFNFISAEKLWNFNNHTVNISDDLYVGGTIYGTVSTGGYWNLSGSNLFPSSTSYKVGIGTSSPNNLLEIVGGTTGTETSLMQIRSNFATENTATALRFVNSGTATSTAGGEISVKRTATAVNTMTFKTSNSDGNLIDTLTINNGNVGIGTTTPSAKLHVVSTSAEGTPSIDSVTSAVFQRAGTSASQNTVSILAGSSGIAELSFGDKDSQKSGYIDFNNSDNSFNFIATPKGTVMTLLGSSGNVGIGTTSPDQKLHVYSDGASDTTVHFEGSGAYLELDGRSKYATINFQDDDVNEWRIGQLGTTSLKIYEDDSTARLTILNGGNVGIGTTNPIVNLQVVNSTQIGGAGSGGLGQETGILYLGGSSAGPLWYTTSIRTINTDVSPSTWKPRLGFFTQVTGTHLAINQTERMSILSDSGNVGIGTTTPSSKLHIQESTGANIILNSNTEEVGSGVYMSEGNSATPMTNGAYVYYNGSTNLFNIATGTSTLTDRLTIVRDTGNVGIGTTVTPSEKLEVNGNIKIQSNNYIAMLSTPTGGSGGYVQGTGEAGTNAGYGAWLNYNAYWNGTQWIQPRGTLPSYLYSTNHHLGWTWRTASANETNGAVITPTQLMVLTTTGNLGIGTTPSYKLDVAGDINAYNLKINGTAVGAGSLTGAGTYGYIPMWNGTTSINNSAIYQNGSNVGIGTKSPSSKLQIGTNTVSQQWSSTTIPYVLIQGVNNEVVVPAFSIVDENLIELFRVSSDGAGGVNGGKTYINGSLGIGTTNPGAQFNVYGTTTIGLSNLANAYILAGATTNGIGIDSNEIISRGNSLNFGTSDANGIWFIVNGTNKMTLDPTGKLGIGTTSPSEELSVSGGVNIWLG